MKLLSKMMHLQEAYGAVTDSMLRGLATEERVPLYRLEGLRGFYPVFRKIPPSKKRVQICRDIVCLMRGGPDYCAKLKSALEAQPGVEVEEVSCLGRCDTAPAVSVQDIPVTGSIETILDYVSGKQPLPSLQPSITKRCWPTDPYEHDSDRYGVLKKILTSSDDRQRDEVLKTLKESDLRGLGGAAFPTGLKWELTRKAEGKPKYVICNADESEPGTFKDRVILEELPHLVIEAMTLAGWMIGAKKGIVYIRHEYGREKIALQAAIDSARDAGALGKNIFGSGIDFDITVFVSPGGYIMGEETALLEALEDKRGEPRNKPPFPVTQGLWGKPTLMNNVETFAAIPVILARGAKWWADQGKPPYKGLKFMSVSGDVVNPGVYCVPWGTSVEDLLAVCGGIINGQSLHAFSPGGASTNFLPASKSKTPLDFKAMQEAGSSLGTGAMVFMSDQRNVLELAISEVRFFRNESCGKCVPCRVGSHKAVELVEAALNGKSRPDTLSRLHELNATLAQTSICGLGQVAMAPLMSVIHSFPDEALPQLNGGNQSKT